MFVNHVIRDDLCQEGILERGQLLYSIREPNSWDKVVDRPKMPLNDLFPICMERLGLYKRFEAPACVAYTRAGGYQASLIIRNHFQIQCATGYHPGQ